MLNAIKRALIVFIGIALQLAFAISIRLFFYEHLGIITIFYSVVSILIVLGILKDSIRLSNDLPWIILILIFPILGTILFITLGRSYKKSKLLKNIFSYEDKYEKYLKQDSKTIEEINSKQLDNIKYITNRTNYTVSSNNQVTYYKSGEEFYPELLKELKKAEKFIFMEYFILNKGTMWSGILDVLKEKAANGVDVRIMYDDMGSIAMLSTKYPKELAKYGIKCIAFNKITPFKGIFMNNRDHRKMTIIDGKVAFSGGVNISDEYININSPVGIWKDNGIKIVGDSIWNLTVLFLTLWNANTNEDKDINKFKYDFKEKIKKDGYVIPYGVAPTILSSMDESGSPWPGFVYRVQGVSGSNKYYFQINDSHVINYSTSYNLASGIDVEIVRENGIMYTKVNDIVYTKVLTYKDNIDTFDIPLTIGGNINADGDYDRTFKGVLSNVSVEFYEGSIVNNTNYTYTETRTSTSYNLDGTIEFDGTNYIDTGINLFSAENINKDFEISLTINQVGGNVAQATLMNLKDEGQNNVWPGVAYRTRSGGGFEFSARWPGQSNVSLNETATPPKTIALARRNGIIYYSINGSEEATLIATPASSLNMAFGSNLTFGASLNGSGSPFRYFTGVVSNISVELFDN